MKEFTVKGYIEGLKSHIEKETGGLREALECELKGAETVLRIQRERARKNTAKYRKEHPEYVKGWREKNRDKYNEYHRKYRKRNKELTPEEQAVADTIDSMEW